ncbi:MAG: GNAT family N-acetyltransferase [Bryobacterales bacterium]|nr:GNAT family N-acetyltransferase [Bryobacterales bacterium]
MRSFRATDAEELARHANNRRVWLQLRDRFPHPYAIDDARRFIAFARRGDPETTFAVTVDDVSVGAIGATLRDDVERCSAEVGYWLGEPYWGRGIATTALAGFTRYAFPAYNLERLYAVPFASNTAVRSKLIGDFATADWVTAELRAEWRPQHVVVGDYVHFASKRACEGRFQGACRLL